MLMQFWSKISRMFLCMFFFTYSKAKKCAFYRLNKDAMNLYQIKIWSKNARKMLYRLNEYDINVPNLVEFILTGLEKKSRFHLSPFS